MSGGLPDIGPAAAERLTQKGQNERAVLSLAQGIEFSLTAF